MSGEKISQLTPEATLAPTDEFVLATADKKDKVVKGSTLIQATKQGIPLAHDVSTLFRTHN